MKKMMCIFVLLAFISSTVIMTGCGSSGSGWSWVAAALVITAIASSGGAGGVAFAASTRNQLRFQAASTYVADVYLNDEFQKTVGATVKDANTLEMAESVRIDNLPHGGHEYKVIFRLRTKTNGMMVVGYENLTAGDNAKTPEATPKTTAKALVYQQWKNVTVEAAGSNYQEFETKATADGADTLIDTIVSDIPKDLAAIVDKTDPTDDFTTAQTKIDAAATAIEAPDATTPPTAGMEGAYRGSLTTDSEEEMYIFVGKKADDSYEMVFGASDNNDTPVIIKSTTAVSGNVIGFGFNAPTISVVGTGSIKIEPTGAFTLTTKVKEGTNPIETNVFKGKKLQPMISAANPANVDARGIYTGYTMVHSTTGHGDSEPIGMYFDRGTTNTAIYVFADEKLKITSATFGADTDGHTTVDISETSDQAFSGTLTFRKDGTLGGTVTAGTNEIMINTYNQHKFGL